MDEHDYSEMSSEDYNRLYTEIHGRLTDEEKRFWAKTAALNIETSVRRAERAESEARRWLSTAIFFGVVSILTSLLWSL